MSWLYSEGLSLAYLCQSWWQTLLARSVEPVCVELRGTSKHWRSLPCLLRHTNSSRSLHQAPSPRHSSRPEQRWNIWHKLNFSVI